MVIPPVLAPLLWAPGIAMEALVGLRNRLYDDELMPSRLLPRPVISIGNLTLGGSGKTPLVIAVASRVAAGGGVPVVLSRGYGRPHSGRARVIPPGAAADDAELGDEPALVRRRVPAVWLGLGRDRHAVGQAIAEREPRATFVLDDGFQHRRLARDLDLVVIDRSQPLTGNRVVPRGTLREPLVGLARAGAVVLHGLRPAAGADPLEAVVRGVNPRAAVLYAESRIGALVPFEAWREQRSEARSACPRSIYAVAAIGNPLRYRDDLAASGFRVAGARFFRDHHRISPGEWRECTGAALASGAEAVVITEKDAIKVQRAPEAPLLVAVQEFRLSNDGELERALRTLGDGR